MTNASQEKGSDTLERIQKAAVEEFSRKGFRGASLRQIVKQAGVTTGAFYGYFSSKEALFASIVEPHAAALMDRFVEGQNDFTRLPEEERPAHMGEGSGQYLHWLVSYLCDNRVPVKLLLNCAEGTRYEDFIHKMVEIEVDATLDYVEVCRRLGKQTEEIDRPMCQILASGMFNGIFEIVLRDMPYERAIRYVDQLRDFYAAGWTRLITP